MSDAAGRVVPAVHGRREVPPDPAFEREFAARLRAMDAPALLELYARFAHGDSPFDEIMRRILVNAMVRSCGDGLHVGRGVLFRHPETFTIGRGVFLGDGAVLQGRFDGACSIGDGTWIGPQAFLDARDLVLGERVGWGPGARVLGSTHRAEPVDVPVIETELRIRPVRVGAWADIGVSAVLLPGVTVGQGAIVGAGAVVTHDLPPFAVAAGVPARVVRYRTDEPGGSRE
jgi:acetyltransferase-like isoleucine patch superfamily enzyme